MVLVTLKSPKGGVYKQATAQAGHVQFQGVSPSRYTVQVVAAGFERSEQEFEAEGTVASMISIEMQPATAGSSGTPLATSGFPVLTPKAQKQLGMAQEALKANKLSEARSHLDEAQRLAPNHPEVNYLFGTYWEQVNDPVQTKAYFARAIDAYPKHIRALLSLSEVLLKEGNPAEAVTYLNRAVEAEPGSWRAQAFLAEAYLRTDALDDAIKHAERALELGHERAESAELILARAMTARATRILQTYLQDHPGDLEVKKLLDGLKTPPAMSLPMRAEAAPASEVRPPAPIRLATEIPSASLWMPPNVDERVPGVEPGAVCALEEIVRNAGERVQEFVRNVDRFTATESLMHESIDKWGLVSSRDKRKYDYVVSIGEVRPGFLNVEEYRRSGSSEAGFPNGVITNGLPAMILIFHPYNIGSFDLTCEGLAHWNGELAWQVHFRQRVDKPNTVRSYKVGLNGKSYPIALKGRAWIAADSYQVVRLETDLVAPIPEIRLVADHTAIDYNPVHFSERKVDMWLPQNAEVYYDWRGRRSHRRHSFSEYFLFSVDDKQRISTPKIEDQASPDTAIQPTKPTH
jgi:hypothetical protein